LEIPLGLILRKKAKKKLTSNQFSKFNAMIYILAMSLISDCLPLLFLSRLSSGGWLRGGFY